jgi:hypothetical protein
MAWNLALASSGLSGCLSGCHRIASFLQGWGGGDGGVGVTQRSVLSAAPAAAAARPRGLPQSPPAAPTHLYAFLTSILEAPTCTPNSS